MPVTVKNLNRTSWKKCKCGSWLKHWENYSKQKALLCANRSCGRLANLGGHIKKDSSVFMEHYIVPLCSSCNKIPSIQTFSVNKPMLVRASITETCGRM